MHTYEVYIFRKEYGGRKQEACVELAHMSSPQFRVCDGSRMTEEQAKLLIGMAFHHLDGVVMKTDLETLTPLPHPADPT